MFPCPTSDCSYSLENKTEIRQVKILYLIFSLLDINPSISNADIVGDSDFTLKWSKWPADHLVRC